MGYKPVDVFNLKMVEFESFLYGFDKMPHGHPKTHIGFDHVQVVQALIDAFMGNRRGFRTPAGQQQVPAVGTVGVQVAGKNLGTVISQGEYRCIRCNDRPSR